MRTLAVAACLGLVTLVPGCGTLGESTTDVGQALGGDGAVDNNGDTSPGQLVDVGEEESAPEDAAPAPTKQALPDGPDTEPEKDEDPVHLDAMDQPGKEFQAPEMPGKPAEDSDELTHLVYLLETSAWAAAGVVVEDTDTECGISESDLRQTGKHEFDCTVSFSGASVDYEVTAEVKDKKMPVTMDTERLPVSEDKAVHEATRQAFKPARVTCDIVGVETVRVGKQDGFTCWVTDVENDRTTYQGEVLDDGTLVLRQQ